MREWPVCKCAESLMCVQPPELGVAGSNPAWVTTTSLHEIQGLGKLRERRNAIPRSKGRAGRRPALVHADLWVLKIGPPRNC